MHCGVLWRLGVCVLFCSVEVGRGVLCIALFYTVVEVGGWGWEGCAVDVCSVAWVLIVGKLTISLCVCFLFIYQSVNVNVALAVLVLLLLWVIYLVVFCLSLRSAIIHQHHHQPRRYIFLLTCGDGISLYFFVYQIRKYSHL